MSTTFSNKRTCLDLTNKDTPFHSLGLKNGQLLYISTKNTNTSECKTTSKTPNCSHGPGGKCLKCIAPDTTPKTSAKNCLHGERAVCVNCLSSKNNPLNSKPLRCKHKEDTFCNNCIPVRNLTKAEEIQLVKRQNCSCKSPKQRCLYCSATNLSFFEDKHTTSYSHYLHKRKLNCAHQKSSFDKQTGFCGNCAPEEMASFRMRKCPGHAPWPKAVCTRCAPPNIVIKLQPYRHCDEASAVDMRPLQKFISSWLAGVQTQRACLLVGNYERVTDPAEQASLEGVHLVRANIHAIHCSLFESGPNGPIFKGGREFDELLELTANCGLEIVGWAVTALAAHEERYGGQMLMAAAHFLRAADFQILFGDERGHSRFVTMLISHNDAGEVEPKCYQVSDQCVALRRDKLLATTDDPGLITVSPPRDGRYMPTVIYKGKDLRPGEKFLPDEFLVKVGAMQPHRPTPIFRRCSFPLQGAADSDLKALLSATMAEPYHRKFSDFALLFWIRTKVGLDKACELARCAARAENVSKSLGESLDSALAEFFVFQ